MYLRFLGLGAIKLFTLGLRLGFVFEVVLWQMALEFGDLLMERS